MSKGLTLPGRVTSSFGHHRSVLRFLPMCIITSKFRYDNSSRVWHRSLVLKWYSFTYSLVYLSSVLHRTKETTQFWRNLSPTLRILWIATRRLWGTIRFDVHLLQTSEGQGGWLWNTFKNFLINLCKEEWFWRALIFFENFISPLRLSLLRLGSYKS